MLLVFIFIFQHLLRFKMIANINLMKLKRYMSLCLMAGSSLLYTVPSLAQTPAILPESSLERLDPAFDALVSPGAKTEVIASGFEWIEGPVWVESQKMLLASDVMKNIIYKWTAAKGKEVYLTPSGYTQSKPRGKELGSNGLSLDPQGRLVLAQHGDRRIARMDAPIEKPKPKYTALAADYEGKKFNSPNDLAIAPNGTIYFTDPPYGFENGVDDPLRELPYHGVYKIKDGKVMLMTDTLSRPNGIALFPDGKRLLVANSDGKKPNWYVYDIDKNGDLHNGRIFLNSRTAFNMDRGGPDGIEIDPKGNVFATGPGGVCIVDSEGKPLGRILVTGRTSNVAFANNYKTLFITADDYLLKIEL
jgi:gluconolactonase